jgi:2-oxoglutarate ferredoxin oxidoreductase subunit delta
MTEEKKDPKTASKRSKFKIHILEEWCKGCGFCVEFCPKNILQLSPKKFNAKGYHPPETVNPETCTGCDMCRMVCPEFSIYITKEEKE